MDTIRKVDINNNIFILSCNSYLCIITETMRPSQASRKHIGTNTVGRLGPNPTSEDMSLRREERN